jgi:hypothetical protein
MANPTSTCRDSVRDIEEGQSIAGKRKQTEQQPVVLFSKNAIEDGRLRKHLEDNGPGMNQGRDCGPRDGILPPRHERAELRRYDGVIPGGDVEASHGVEDVWRIEPSDTTIEGTRDLDTRVTEKVFGQRAEGMPPGYLDEEMCIHDAIVDGDLDLRKTQRGCLSEPGCSNSQC